jgi:hypothetical protein
VCGTGAALPSAPNRGSARDKLNSVLVEADQNKAVLLKTVTPASACEEVTHPLACLARRALASRPGRHGSQKWPAELSEGRRPPTCYDVGVTNVEDL